MASSASSGSSTQESSWPPCSRGCPHQRFAISSGSKIMVVWMGVMDMTRRYEYLLEPGFGKDYSIDKAIVRGHTRVLCHCFGGLLGAVQALTFAFSGTYVGYAAVPIHAPTAGTHSTNNVYVYGLG
ncbi:uncharacterized protein SPPG_09140 [Spizellomyces punctatus DAOM BR117]|uniref:Uncharacterized protein n=1 Tax=Spizellomyces punctatus (strain DAOM BR117) TaxID=645134 RepID=A0A0L0HGP5_SPIPD|nr:uncharacterized protein SPPG_09140 [Spizellomyces punctatus DAOM BR117]KND00636.1 hypothetical protein SPPG_09140 [Spizellomyces punctatus DAOM BR117]|eukprot:XP_016608675.1 hypothetical protein SPPG_09140 [Spizellomyces punctatus DAOM BR117]